MLALVPVKSFGAAKQRLASLLHPGERAALSMAMARDVLAALAATPEITRILICAGDDAAASLAREAHAELVLEHDLGTTGLNNVVTTLARRLAADGEPALLVLHSDLPGVRAADIAAAARALAGADVVVTPDGDELGSNILGWRLASGFVPRYGTRSFLRHQQQAAKKGLKFSVCRGSSARLDIDNPVDLCTFLALASEVAETHTLKFLQTSGIAERLRGHGTAESTRGASHHAVL